MLPGALQAEDAQLRVVGVTQTHLSSSTPCPRPTFRGGSPYSGLPLNLEEAPKIGSGLLQPS